MSDCLQNVCSKDDAAWRLTRFRMPMIMKHLRVVLCCKNRMQPGELRTELASLSAETRVHYSSDIYQEPLKLGPFEVVAIYALTPPEPGDKAEEINSARQAWRQTVMSARKWVTTIISRFMLYSQLVHYGLTPILKMNSWVGSLNTAVHLGTFVDIENRWMYHLQTMCVAKERQRQGMGAAVIRLAKREILHNQISGMKGYCQSDGTRAFYERQGFVSRDVFTNPPSDLLVPGIRKHFLVVWDAGTTPKSEAEVLAI